MNYVEVHIGDYSAATFHLTPLEDGIYWRLLRCYYRDERPLPADIKTVERMAGARTQAEQDAVATVLRDFFTEGEDGFRQVRCDSEIRRYVEKSAKARASAAASWASRCERNANAMRSHSDRNAHQTPDTSISTTEVVEKAPRAKRAAPTPAAPEGVDAQTWSDWFDLRKKKRAPVTATVIESAVAEAAKAGMTLDAFLRVWCFRGSQGLRADWIRAEDRARVGQAATQATDIPQWRREQMARTAAFAGRAATKQAKQVAAEADIFDTHPEVFHDAPRLTSD